MQSALTKLWAIGSDYSHLSHLQLAVVSAQGLENHVNVSCRCNPVNSCLGGRAHRRFIFSYPGGSIAIPCGSNSSVGCGGGGDGGVESSSRRGRGRRRDGRS